MISVRQCNSVTVVQPQIHRLDEILGRQLIIAMRDYTTPGANLVLNLNDVIYLNSEAVGYISTCARRMAHHRGGLAICCLQDGPKGIFQILRMERIVRGIYESEEDAVESFEQPLRR